MNTRQFYDDLMQKLLAWAESQPDIRAIILIGSQASQIKPADDYSDLDIEVFIPGSATCTFPTKAIAVAIPILV